MVIAAARTRDIPETNQIRKCFPDLEEIRLSPYGATAAAESIVLSDAGVQIGGEAGKIGLLPQVVRGPADGRPQVFAGSRPLANFEVLGFFLRNKVTCVKVQLMIMR